MKLSTLNKEQALKVLKAAVYVGLSAVLDYLISETSGTQFGVLTAPINTGLVLIKQLFTEK